MEATLSKDTVALIDKLKSLVEKKGIVKDDVVKLLTELRPHFIEQKEPLITRVTRLTAEYIDDKGTFDINLLAEEDEEGNIDQDIDMNSEDSFNDVKENFLYLLDLFAHPENSVNKEELQRIKAIYLDRDMF
ncbi:hypothetical protein G3O08_02630 [Cryomorpha ignava]|uniref:Uncharacterized protein n=1 Tax=Cryomorpha ignava TaxID=101383 RepID=A0A7K3WL79_9FLAO|nr:hypothetical protein [Cryomorpha ignava]NEN22397.1 hypothetical protein [Cryomorpha ignava]